VHRQTDGLIEVSLVAGQLDPLHDLRLRRQFRGNRCLGASQDERTQSRRQRRLALAVPPLLDRRPEQPAELLVGAEQAGHQEGEIRP
jgi:hypothetical protein